MTPRIMIELGQTSGQPCIRGLRITVWDVLNWLAAGMTEREILENVRMISARQATRVERRDYEEIR
jgi:uncharacterized protein (DUF433 family)